jgi:hypothetical protein
MNEELDRIWEEPIGLLSRNLPGGTEKYKKKKKPQAGVQAEIRSENLSNTILERCCYANLFRVRIASNSSTRGIETYEIQSTPPWVPQPLRLMVSWNEE